MKILNEIKNPSKPWSQFIIYWFLNRESISFVERAGKYAETLHTGIEDKKCSLIERTDNKTCTYNSVLSN